MAILVYQSDKKEQEEFAKKNAEIIEKNKKIQEGDAIASKANSEAVAALNARCLKTGRQRAHALLQIFERATLNLAAFFADLERFDPRAFHGSLFEKVVEDSVFTHVWAR